MFDANDAPRSGTRGARPSDFRYFEARAIASCRSAGASVNAVVISKLFASLTVVFPVSSWRGTGHKALTGADIPRRSIVDDKERSRFTFRFVFILMVVVGCRGGAKEGQTYC